MRAVTIWGQGDLQLLPEVDHFPQKEVPYPISNGGQQFRRAGGSCPVIPLHLWLTIDIRSYYYLEKTQNLIF